MRTLLDLLPSKMIIAIMRDERHIGGNGKGEVDYDFDTDSDTDAEDDDVVEINNGSVGWAYIGSHNFTPSAWGNLSGSSFNPILNVRLIALQIVCLYGPTLDISHSIFLGYKLRIGCPVSAQRRCPC